MGVGVLTVVWCGVVQGFVEGLKMSLPWTVDQMVTLQRAVGTVQGRAGVHLVFQHHMDRVYVPPGCPHAVCNLLPNAKFAMDGSTTDFFPAYVEANRVVRPWVPPSATDYGDAAGRMFRALL